MATAGYFLWGKRGQEEVWQFFGFAVVRYVVSYGVGSIFWE